MSHNSFVSPAQAYINQQDEIVSAGPSLSRLFNAIGYSVDLTINQWAQWFAAAMDFKPDLIVEFGRNHGNSTSIFTEAANRLGDCRVVSLCWSEIWRDETAPKLAEFMPAEWFEPLDPRIGNILAFDPKEIVGESQRVLICWDAHGIDIAEYILSKFMPAIWPREHLVLMHDISDSRYSDPRQSYNGAGLWRGSMARGENNESVLHIENMISSVAQTLAVYDFTKRNAVAMYSADHSLHTQLSSEDSQTLTQKIGDMFSLSANWWYWSLSELPANTQIFFPEAPQRIDSNEMDLLGPLSPTSLNIDRLQQRILQMEASPFWKMRTAVKRMRKGGKP